MGRSEAQEGVWVESLVQIMNLLLIHSANCTSDLLGVYHLYKKIDVNGSCIH